MFGVPVGVPEAEGSGEQTDQEDRQRNRASEAELSSDGNHGSPSEGIRASPRNNILRLAKARSSDVLSGGVFRVRDLGSLLRKRRSAPWANIATAMRRRSL